jgi:hypothetical protein
MSDGLNVVPDQPNDGTWVSTTVANADTESVGRSVSGAGSAAKRCLLGRLARDGVVRTDGSQGYGPPGKR